MSKCECYGFLGFGRGAVSAWKTCPPRGAAATPAPLGEIRATPAKFGTAYALEKAAVGKHSKVS